MHRPTSTGMTTGIRRAFLHTFSRSSFLDILSSFFVFYLFFFFTNCTVALVLTLDNRRTDTNISVKCTVIVMTLWFLSTSRGRYSITVSQSRGYPVIQISTKLSHWVQLSHVVCCRTLHMTWHTPSKCLQYCSNALFHIHHDQTKTRCWCSDSK